MDDEEAPSYAEASEGRPDRVEVTAGRYTRILRAVAETPWALLPSKLAVIVDLLAARHAGHRPTAAEIRARIGAQDDGRGFGARRGAIAVLPADHWMSAPDRSMPLRS